jgi:hypothetical protein
LVTRADEPLLQAATDTIFPSINAKRLGRLDFGCLLCLAAMSKLKNKEKEKNRNSLTYIKRKKMQ